MSQLEALLALSNDQFHQLAVYTVAQQATLEGWKVSVVDEGRRFRLLINGQSIQVRARRVDGAYDTTRPEDYDGTAFVDFSASSDRHLRYTIFVTPAETEKSQLVDGLYWESRGLVSA